MAPGPQNTSSHLEIGEKLGKYPPGRFSRLDLRLFFKKNFEKLHN
jgi:hypothetical protein